MKTIQESLKQIPYIKMTGFLALGDVTLGNWHLTLAQAKNRTGKPSLAVLKGIQASVQHYHDMLIDALENPEKVQAENGNLLNKQFPLASFSTAELTEHIEILDTVDNRLNEKIQKTEIKKQAKAKDSKSIKELLEEDDSENVLPQQKTTVSKQYVSKKIPMSGEKIAKLAKKFKAKEASDDDVSKFLSLQTSAKSKTKSVIKSV